MRALSRDDIRDLVPMEKAIELVKLAFKDLSAGFAEAPLRTPVEVVPGRAVTLVMPAHVPSADALGLKVVSVFRDNPAKGLPTITALVTLLDRETGQPIAIMDGSYLTALRTGAVSGAATDLLARPDARTLAVIGAGAQAVTQAAAIDAVRPIERILVVARTEESFERFREAIAQQWPGLLDRVEMAPEVAGAVREADVICCATSSATPVFDHADLKPGVHINGVGSFTPTMQEVPAETVAAALVVVDQRHAALEEGGDLVIPMKEGLFGEDHIHAELGELVAGAVAGRTGDDQVTFFKSVGNAVQDMAVGRFALDEAERRGVGQVLRLF